MPLNSDLKPVSQSKEPPVHEMLNQRIVREDALTVGHGDVFISITGNLDKLSTLIDYVPPSWGQCVTAESIKICSNDKSRLNGGLRAALIKKK